MVPETNKQNKLNVTFQISRVNNSNDKVHPGQVGVTVILRLKLCK